MSTKHYDYFVVGCGSGGTRSARIAAGHGAKVAIAEKSKLGGTCVNLGCVPKKIFAYGSDYGEHFEDAKAYGWSADNVAFDWKTMVKAKDAYVGRINKFYASMLDNNGIDLFEGEARFIDENTVEVNGEHITADRFMIAVGGKPKQMDIPGGEFLAVSDDIFHWPKSPKKVVIVGGGYIAVELAHVFSGIGCDVTVLYYKDLFLRGFDRSIREKLAEDMKKQGINLCFNSSISSVEKNGDEFIVHTKEGQSFECDLPIAAVGRVPVTNTLGIDKAGIEVDQNGLIIVDEEYQTSNEKVYAVGDVTDTYHLTPVAIAEGHVVADRLFNKQKDRVVNYDNVATVVFSNPPIGTIGYSEDAAIEKGFDVKIYQTEFTAMRHSVAGRDQKTFMKLVVDQKTDRVIGLHMIGLDAPEIMQGFSVAMNAGATKADFDRTIPIHPTSAEEFVTIRKAVGED